MTALASLLAQWADENSSPSKTTGHRWPQLATLCDINNLRPISERKTTGHRWPQVATLSQALATGGHNWPKVATENETRGDGVTQYGACGQCGHLWPPVFRLDEIAPETETLYLHFVSTVSGSCIYSPEALAARFDEIAAQAEYDGGASREEAEAIARACLIVEVASASRKDG